MQKQPEWTILKILEWTTSYFKSHNIDSPRTTAEILLAHTLNVKRIDLYLQFDKPLDKDELALFKSLIKRRKNREPVAYITGSKGFWSFDLEITKDTLIPRPETECLVEKALKLLPEDLTANRVLELGTGSGAIIIALASERPHNIFFATDYSVAALMVAQKNATNNLSGTGINFFSSDWFAPLKKYDQIKFDIIISNPPYIKSAVIPTLQPEIWKYEPLNALDGGPNGLSAYRQILAEAHHYLKEDGNLLFEIGHDQKPELEAIIEQSKVYSNPVFFKDYSKFYRIVSIKKQK